MGKGETMEQRFSAYLDRILAGEDVGTPPDLDEKYLADLEFALKMVQLRVMPSPAYQARLKAELLHKLAERDMIARERRGFFSWSFWQEPLWRSVTIVALVVLMGVILWRADVLPMIGPATTATPTATTTTTATTSATTTATMTTTATTTATTTQSTMVPGQLLVAEAGTDKPVYESGEAVKIDVILKNISSTVMTLQDLPPILSIMSADTGRPAYTFGAGDATMTLARDGTATFTYEWDQRDFDGRAVTGRYYIELEDLEYNGIPVQLKLGEPVEFDILAAR